MAIPLSRFLPLGSLSTSSCEPSSRLGDHNECCACPAVDDRMWLGASLLDELSRDCRSGKHHHTKFYGDTRRFEQERPLGSFTFFETAFTQAFRTDYLALGNTPRTGTAGGDAEEPDHGTVLLLYSVCRGR
ncbi:MAG: hypothetical protein Q9204_001081 [Flavoplaca sp. TL-2023a]